jgi:hypothetical protein
MRELQKGVAQVNLATLKVYPIPCEIQKRATPSACGNRQFDEQPDMRHGRGIHQRADFCAGKKLVYWLRFVRSFDVRGTGYQSLLFGPSKHHSQVTEFGMDCAGLNAVTETRVSVGSAVGNRNSMSLHRPQPIS